MGLVKTRPRLAEDGSPHRAGAGVLPMWECCQFHCCQFPIGDGERILERLAEDGSPYRTYT